MVRRLAPIAVLAVTLAVAFAPPAGARPGTPSRAWRAFHLSGAAVSPARVAAGTAAPLVNWASAGTMGTAVSESGGGGFFQGRVVVPGGFKSDGTLFDDVQTLTLNSNTWTTDAANPIPGTNTDSPRADFAVCTDKSGKIHLLNGQGIDAGGNSFVYAAHFVYDPKAPSGARWTFLAYPKLASGAIYYSLGSGCAFIANKLYLFGGLGIVDPPGTGGVVPQGLTWVYDPLTGTWSDTGMTMFQGRFWAGYTASNTNAY